MTSIGDAIKCGENTCKEANFINDDNVYRLQALHEFYEYSALFRGEALQTPVCDNGDFEGGGGSVVKIGGRIPNAEQGGGIEAVEFLSETLSGGFGHAPDVVSDVEFGVGV